MQGVYHNDKRSIKPASQHILDPLLLSRGLRMCFVQLSSRLRGLEFFMEVSVIIPVYNEKATIQQVIDLVQQAPYPKEIIIVDDCSTDGTREILEGGSWPGNVHIYYHAKNMGKGAGVRTGIQQATKDIIVIQDADLEYDPKDLDVVLKPILDGKADVVYGSRFLGIHRAFLFWHYLGNKLLTFITNLLYNNMLTDMETGYKAFRAPILKSMKIRSNRFDFEPEI